MTWSLKSLSPADKPDGQTQGTQIIPFLQPGGTAASSPGHQRVLHSPSVFLWPRSLMRLVILHGCVGPAIQGGRVGPWMILREPRRSWPKHCLPPHPLPPSVRPRISFLVPKPLSQSWVSTLCLCSNCMLYSVFSSDSHLNAEYWVKTAREPVRRDPSLLQRPHIVTAITIIKVINVHEKSLNILEE